MMSEAEGRRRDGGSTGCHDDEVPGESQSTASGQDAESAERLARDAIYQLLAIRARSRAELRRALRRKGIDQDVAEAVLGKFVDAGLIDDAAFAEHWVEARQRNQHLGRKALGFELRNKGIDEQTVSAAMSHVDDDAEEERARELVRRRLSAMTSIDDTVKTRRLLGMLARKGYSESLAFRIVREELENSGTSGVEFEDL